MSDRLLRHGQLGGGALDTQLQSAAQPIWHALRRCSRSNSQAHLPKEAELVAHLHTAHEVAEAPSW